MEDERYLLAAHYCPGNSGNATYILCSIVTLQLSLHVLLTAHECTVVGTANKRANIMIELTSTKLALMYSAPAAPVGRKRARETLTENKQTNKQTNKQNNTSNTHVHCIYSHP